MRILLHAGAHPTDEDKLFASLDANAPLLAKQGIALPRVQSYRRPLRQAMMQVVKNQPAVTARQTLMYGMFQDKTNIDAMILSLPVFFGSPKGSIHYDKFFPDAVKHLERFCQIFQQDQIEMFFSIRNPATFIPASMVAAQAPHMNDILKGSNYMALRWSELFARIHTALPQIKITVWCDEDTPFIWSQLLRNFASVSRNQAMANGYAIFAQILTPEGFERFKGYMQKHPDMNPLQRRKVMYAFAQKFARKDVVEQDLHMTPWDQTTVDQLSEIYDHDVDRIAELPGVTLIEP